MNHQNRDREAELTRLQSWKETENGQRSVTTVRRLLALPLFLQNIIQIFQRGNVLLLPILLRLMRMEVQDAFYGTNTTAQSLAKELYNYSVGQPDIPDVGCFFPMQM